MAITSSRLFSLCLCLVTFISACEAQLQPDTKFEVLGMGGAGGMYTPTSSPNNPDLMLVSCDMGGSYRSLDGGKRWNMIHTLQLKDSLGCKPCFVGDDIYWIRGNELRVSHDNAETWLPVNTNVPWVNAKVANIAALPTTPATLFVRAGNSIYQSLDVGKTWYQVKQVDGATTGAIAATDTVVYTALGSMLQVTSDAGKTWRSVMIPQAENKNIISLAVGASGGNKIVYAAVEEVGVMRSVNRGETWTLVLSTDAGDGTAFVDIVMSNNQTKIAYACNRNEIFRTIDAGQTWSSCFKMHGKDANVELSWVQTEIKWGYYISPLGLGVNFADPNIVMVTTQGEFYKSTDAGESWHQVINKEIGVIPPDSGVRYQCIGLEVTSVWDFLFDPFDPNRYYIAYTDMGFARSVDRGKYWIHSTSGSPWRNTFYDVEFDPYIPGKLYAAASNRHDIPHWTHITPNRKNHSGGVIISTDYGTNWKRATNGLPAKPCTSICIDPKTKKDNLTLYVTMYGDGVYKSIDNAKTWVKKSRGLGNPGNLHANHIEIHPVTGDIYSSITANRHDMKFPVPGGIFKSTNGGEIWTDITKQIKLRWITSFALHPTNPDIIYISAATLPGSAEGGLYKTINGGESWNRIRCDKDFLNQGGAGYVQAMNVVLHPDNPDYVYLCTAGHGLWFSPDAGKTWQRFADLPFAPAQNVAFNPAEKGIIYVATFGGGTWRGPERP